MSSSTEPIAHPSAAPPGTGLRLKDLLDLVESHRSWFEQEAYCEHAGRTRKKNMYDVCSELIIPMTTCQERLVTLQEQDLGKLRPSTAGGVLVSMDDLTLDPNAGDYVYLGGSQIPTGLTIHGRLCGGGCVRRSYWALGDARDSMWRTRLAHGRESQSVTETAPLPKSLKQAQLEGIIGETENTLRNKLAELQVGDIIVLRWGISFVDVCAPTCGPIGYPLNTFVSHFWGEETVDFVTTLMHHAQKFGSDRDHFANHTYYICTFSNCQHRVELGDSWQASPFNQALEYLADGRIDVRAEAGKVLHEYDVVMVLDAQALPLTRKWCVFEAWRCIELGLPLRLFCPEGEITRGSVGVSSSAVMQRIKAMDLEEAKCSVQKDALMIHRAVEDSKGGFAAVHAALRLRVLDLLTFISSLAINIDHATGRPLEEIKLTLQVCAPNCMKGKILCSDSMHLKLSSVRSRWRRLLLVAPAGSGKTVFSRKLLRNTIESSQAVELPRQNKGLLPIRVPLAELARLVGEQVATGDLFTVWAQRSFLQGSRALTDSARARLLILDGFDEAGPYRDNVLSWLRSWLKNHSNDAVMMTTRPSGVDDQVISASKPRPPLIVEVTAVDREGNQLALSEDIPLASCFYSDGLPPCWVHSFNTGLSKLMPPLYPNQLSILDLSSHVEKGTHGPLNIKTLTGQGDGAKILIEVSGVRDVKDVRLEHRIRQIHVTDVGRGYAAGDRVAIDMSQFRREDLNWTLSPDAISKWFAFRNSFDAKGSQVEIGMVREGASLHESTVREQLVSEFGFVDCEIEPISRQASATIVQNIAVQLGQSWTSQYAEQLLDKYTVPSGIRDRPLLASLLGQYLVHRHETKHADDKQLPVTELLIFKYVITKLISEAAEKIGLPSEDIRGKLRAISLEMQRRNSRLMEKETFNTYHVLELFEEARRGHLKLFEPARAGNAVQFYHLRISEILCAEVLVDSQADSIPSLCEDASSYEGFRAPLQFLLTMMIERQNGSLDLDFNESKQEAVDVLSLALSGQLLSALRLNFRSNTNLASIEKLAQGLGSISSLTSLDLSFARCTYLRSVGDIGKVLTRLSKLTSLRLDLSGGSSFQPMKLACLMELGQGLQRLTALRSLELHCCNWPRLASLADLGAGLVSLKVLRALRLHFWRCHSLESVKKLGESFACLDALSSLVLDFRECTQLASLEGVDCGLAHLKVLSSLKLELADCTAIRSVKELGQSLGSLRSLKQLELNFNSCSQLQGARYIPEGLALVSDLAKLELDFVGCHHFPSESQRKFNLKSAQELFTVLMPAHRRLPAWAETHVFPNICRTRTPCPAHLKPPSQGFARGVRPVSSKQNSCVINGRVSNRPFSADSRNGRVSDRPFSADSRNGRVPNRPFSADSRKRGVTQTPSLQSSFWNTQLSRVQSVGATLPRGQVAQISRPQSAGRGPRKVLDEM